MENLTITVIQPDLDWEDKQKNLARFENHFSKLKFRSDLIVLPEMFNTGFVTDPQMIAEDPSGPAFEWIKKQAEVTQSVITGSFAVKDHGSYYNRLIWMRPDGTYECYDKRHLFRYGGEHLHFASGDSKLIAELKGWKICPLVCYDLRFPVWSKNTCTNGIYEYDLLLYIANWPGKRSYAFRQLLIARAIENQSYVIAVNRVGLDGNGTWHQGESTVLDYKGKPLLEIPPDVEDVETVVLNFEKLQEFRSHFPVGLDWDHFSIEE